MDSDRYSWMKKTSMYHLGYDTSQIGSWVVIMARPDLSASQATPWSELRNFQFRATEALGALINQCAYDLSFRKPSGRITRLFR